MHRLLLITAEKQRSASETPNLGETQSLKHSTDYYEPIVVKTSIFSAYFSARIKLVELSFHLVDDKTSIVCFNATPASLMAKTILEFLQFKM